MATISDAWDLYSKLILASTSSRSILTETGRWQKHVVKYFGHEFKVAEITNKKILLFRTNLIKKGLSPQTVAHCLSLLRRVLHRAQQWDIFTGKLPSFDMPKFDNKRVRFLTKTEANLLLQELSLKSPLWHDISLLALHTGLRAGEIFDLRPNHFDRNNSVLYIFDTKSNNRTVPLNAASLAVLERNCCSSDFIFKEREQPIYQVSRIFRDAVAFCGLNIKIKDRRQKVVFHTLRHTFASWLVQSGTPLVVVGQLLGHKTLQITMRYAHLAPSQGASAVKILEQFSSYVNVDTPIPKQPPK